MAEGADTKFLQSKRLSPRTLFIVVLIGSAFFGVLFYTYALESTRPSLDWQVPSTRAQVEEKKLRAALPIRLKISKLNVDARVEYVGVTPDGAMDVPKGPADVAWFEPGRRPGENGSAVIAGHYGWKDGVPAVFDDLHKLQTGDELSIEDEQGEETIFVVRELRRFVEKENAAAVFSSNDGKAHLNLVTCEGVWNKASQSYSKRLVVFTDRKTK